MTFDVLLIALAALVLSNVVLLVAAARSGTLGRADGGDRLADRPPAPGGTPGVRPAGGIASGDIPARVVRRPAEAPPSGDVGAPAHFAPDPAADAASPGVPGAPDAPDVPEASDVPRASTEVASPGASAEPSDQLDQPDQPDRAASRPPRATRASGPAKSAVGAKSAGGAKGGRGRRFRLPSIEVDHARTERVVLSLLTGDDEAPAGEMVDAWERMVGSDRDGGARRSAAVVAFTLDGLDRLTEVAGRDGTERLVGVVLDAIRRSARASDRVASVGRGHFRVLLVDADDAVAARFVGRVRESADRRLAMASPSVGLAAGWSEAASADRLEGAVRAAEERRRADAASGRLRTGGGNPA